MSVSNLQNCRLTCNDEACAVTCPVSAIHTSQMSQQPFIPAPPPQQANVQPINNCGGKPVTVDSRSEKHREEHHVWHIVLMVIFFVIVVIVVIFIYKMLSRHQHGAYGTKSMEGGEVKSGEMHHHGHGGIGSFVNGFILALFIVWIAGGFDHHRHL